MLKELESQLNQAIKLMGIKNLDEFPQIIIAADKDLGGALGSYVAVENKLYMNSLLLDKKKRQHYLSSGNNLGAKYRLATVVHELFHWKDAMEYVHKYGKITNPKEYIEAIREYHRPNVDKLIKKGYNIEGISEYAFAMFRIKRYDEVMTEYRTLLLLERSGQKW